MLLVYFILFSSVFSSTNNRCFHEEMIQNRGRPSLDTYYESPSGHFWIHYDLSGENAPNLTDSNSNNIPDYIESAAEAADSARFVLTEIMKYQKELSDDDGKYDIYILKLGTNQWGFCEYESNPESSFIKIRNSYEGMSDFCDDENDNLWLTVGHEFFHAIQHSYRENTGNDSYFRELTSMWFENIFVPHCYDFLSFVESSSSFFNNIENNFFNSDQVTSYQTGYSLALYAHYLSTIIDEIDYNNQTSSTIMKKFWMEYSSGGTVFSSLKDVLEDQYKTTFSKTWSDFISRNMFCGKFENMDNDIYYHIGQSYINPPTIQYESLVGNTIINGSTFIYDDRVSIASYRATDQYSINAQFLSNSSLWYGYLLKNNEIYNISNSNSFDLFSINSSDDLMLIFANAANADNISYMLNINIEGCMEYNAINYNPNAVIDDGTCIFPIENSLVSIYPNPIDLRHMPLNIIYDQVDNSNIKIEIFDIRGKLISKKIFSGILGRQNMTYNIDKGISSGIYFLKFSSSTNIEILKFVNIK